MMIWEWIKYRINSDKSYKPYQNKNVKTKQNNYCPRYHTSRNRGKVSIVGNNRDRQIINIFQTSYALLDGEEELL